MCVAPGCRGPLTPCQSESGRLLSPAVTEPAHLRATRAAYDTVAAGYATVLRTELDTEPLDRAMLAAFAELVRPTTPARSPISAEAPAGCA